MKLMDFILADKHRYSGEQSGFWKTYWRYEGFRFTVWLRICQETRKKKITKYTIFPIAKLVYKHYKYKFGYDIPYDREIGPGLLIFHIGGIVFSPKSCGRNITISQNTTVGMTVHEGIKEFPILGDNVYLAPGSAVIGGVKVGNNVAIGTNAVLTKSAPDNSVIVGIPGKVISYKGAQGYINNPYE